jgi:TPR repeat protein
MAGAVALSVTRKRARLSARGLPAPTLPLGRAAYPSPDWSPPAWSSGVSPPIDESTPGAARMFERGQALARSTRVAADPAAAFRCYQSAAAEDHARARAYMAWCLETGTGVARSTTAAERAWTEAAMDGDWLAIGRCHELGLGAEPLGTEEALTWYRAEAVSGEALAMFLAGQLEEGGGDGSHDDPDAAQDWYRKGARLGDGACLERLGLLEDDGVAARTHLARAGALGRPAALTALAERLERGSGGPVDEAGAVACLRSAAASDPRAAVRLAQRLEVGWGAPKAPAEAVRLLQQARKAGDGTAIVEEALWLELGRAGALAPDPVGARRLLELHVRSGKLPRAQVALARLLLEGRGGEVEEARGRGLLERAGSDPFARQALAVARLQRTGASPVEPLEELSDLIGVVPCAATAWSCGTLADPGAPDEDRARAGELLRAAARRGDGRAARELQQALERGALQPAWDGELGHWFAEAQTSTPDHGGGLVCVEVLHAADVAPLARLALERAALAGDPEAMRALAEVLRAGRGGPVNEVVAEDWLRRAQAVAPDGPERR